MMAAELGHTQIIKLLLAQGPRRPEGQGGKTAADLADPAVRSCWNDS